MHHELDMHRERQNKTLGQKLQEAKEAARAVLARQSSEQPEIKLIHRS